MNEHASSNITQVLTVFQNFLSTYEHSVWVKNATPEDIKTTFKQGNFIEKTVNTFKSKNQFKQFLTVLEIWCKQKQLKVYNEEFLALANDRLLEKFFKFVNVKELTLDIGVRVYTSIYPKERFANFLQNLILTSSSLSAITDFVNLSVNDGSDLKNGIIFNKWANYLVSGQKNVVKSEIESYLSLYKVETKLEIVLQLLSVKGLSGEEENVQKLILKCVLEKMLDRSILSKNFWVALFKTPKTREISLACIQFKDFLMSLFNFVEYIGSMMKKDSSACFSSWKSDPNFTTCPEIDYFDILRVLKSVCSVDVNVRDYVFNRIEQAAEHSNASLWGELKNEIQ